MNHDLFLPHCVQFITLVLLQDVMIHTKIPHRQAQLRFYILFFVGCRVFEGPLVWDRKVHGADWVPRVDPVRPEHLVWESLDRRVRLDRPVSLALLTTLLAAPSLVGLSDHVDHPDHLGHLGALLQAMAFLLVE